MCSMKVRLASTPVAPRRWRGAEFLQVAREQAGDLDDRSAILGERRHGEGLDDGVVIGGLHGHGDRLVGVAPSGCSPPRA